MISQSVSTVTNQATKSVAKCFVSQSVIRTAGLQLFMSKL